MRTRAWDVAVLLFDEVDLLDVTAVLHVLSETGRHYNFRPYRITLVSVSGRPVASRAQATLVPQKALSELEVPEILLIPGGYGARRLLEDAPAVEWLARTVPLTEWTLTVGEGVLPLAKSVPLGPAHVPASEDVARLLAEFAPQAHIDLGASVTLEGKLGFAKLSAHALEARLRSLDVPIIARIGEDVVVLDLRTVLPGDDDSLSTQLLQGIHA